MIEYCWQCTCISLLALAAFYAGSVDVGELPLLCGRSLDTGTSAVLQKSILISLYDQASCSFVQLALKETWDAMRDSARVPLGSFRDVWAGALPKPGFRSRKTGESSWYVTFRVGLHPPTGSRRKDFSFLLG